MEAIDHYSGLGVMQPQPSSLQEPPATPIHSEFRLKFVGKGEEYFRIWIVNVFLSILTLGIYSVWAKVRREKYFHSSVMLEGSSFEYHGSPMAILKGRALIMILLVSLSIAQEFDPAVYLALLALLLPVAPWFAVRAFRFRAHNTSYRGIRFAFLGSYKEALQVIIGYGFLTLITLGLAYPYWYGRLRLFIVNNIAYGTARLASTATARQISQTLMAPMMLSGLVFLLVIAVFGVLMAVLSTYVKTESGVELESTMPPELAILLATAPIGLMLVLVLSLVFFKALFTVRVGNLLFEGATLGNLRLRSQLALKPYIGIALTNWLLILLTMGLFIPFARIRMAHYRAEALGFSAQGGLDEFVSGEQGKVSALGDEAAELFDLDIAL